MEILSRCRQVGDLNIVLRAELQEPFQTRTGVLRTHAFISMGEQHHQATWRLPLGFRRGDKLINNDLGTIGKVPKLGLPHDQHVGSAKGVTVIKPQDCRLGK